MLRDIRSHLRGIFAKLLLVLLILSFAVWGIEDMLINAGVDRTLATVDGEEISPIAFDHAYRREMDRAREALGAQATPQLLASLGLERQVIEQLITTELLHREAASLGLLPGDETLAEQLQATPAFHNEEGVFDKTIFNAVLRRNNVSERIYASELRKQIATELLLNAIAAGAPVNHTMTATLFALEQQTRYADHITLPLSRIAVPPTPDEATLEEFYTTQSQYFMQPERRSVDMLIIDKAALSTSVDEATLRAAYDERAALFGAENVEPFDAVRPTLEAELRTHTSDNALAELSNTVEDALAAGDTMAEVAQANQLTHKKFTLLDAQGMDRNGDVPEGLPANPEILSTAFSLSEGEDSNLITGEDSEAYVLRITQVEDAAPQPLEEIKDKVLSAWQQAQRLEALYQQAEALRTELATMTEVKAQHAALATHGLKPTQTGALTRTHTGLPRPLVQEIFSTALNAPTALVPAEDEALSFAIPRRIDTPIALNATTVKTDADALAFHDQLAQTQREEVIQAYLLHLRQKYAVTINDTALAALTRRE